MVIFKTLVQMTKAEHLKNRAHKQSVTFRKIKANVILVFDFDCVENLDKNMQDFTLHNYTTK